MLCKDRERFGTTSWRRLILRPTMRAVLQLPPGRDHEETESAQSRGRPPLRRRAHLDREIQGAHARNVRADG